MRPPARRSAGTTFVEAMIAFLVLSLGLLTLSRVQGQLRLTGEMARQRSEAVRLAQEDLERLRSFSSIAPSATGRSYAEVVSSTRTIDSASGYASNTAYLLRRQVAAARVPAAKDIVVTVSWSDRAGERQQVTLASVIAASEPALSGMLGVAPGAAPVNGAMARAPGIPLNARNLGNGRSAYRLAESARVAYVFDNSSGIVIERCHVETRTAGAGLTAADLTGCVHTLAYLMTGVVRFASTSSTPTPALPLPAAVTLTVDGGVYPATPECSHEAVVSSDDRYMAYGCIVYPRVDGRWSGQSRIVPHGWTLGAGPSDLRICAYGTASGGESSAGGDRLARYVDVSGSLGNQNFLLARGDVACPPD